MRHHLCGIIKSALPILIDKALSWISLTKIHLFSIPPMHHLLFAAKWANLLLTSHYPVQTFADCVRISGLT